MSNSTIKRYNGSSWDTLEPITIGQNVYGSGTQATTPLLDSSNQIDSAFLTNYVTLNGTQTITGTKTFTAARLNISSETHFTSGGSPTDYAYGQAVGIFGNAMMCNSLYVPQFKYRTSAMNTAGKSATIWNLPNLDSGSTYTLATTTDLPQVKRFI